jgi:hypothetical protein
VPENEKSGAAQLIDLIIHDVKRLASDEAALAGEQLRPIGRQAKTEAKFLGLGAGLALMAAIALMLACGFGLTWAFQAGAGWSPDASRLAGFSLAALIFGLPGGWLALRGWRGLKAAGRRGRAVLGRVGDDTGQALAALHSGIVQGQDRVAGRDHD